MLDDAALLRSYLIDKIESLAIGHFMRTQDLVATSQAEGIPMSDPAMLSLVKAEGQQYKQEQRDDVNVVSALAQAQGVLSSAQLAALNNACQGRQAGTEMNRLLSSLTHPPR